MNTPCNSAPAHGVSLATCSMLTAGWATGWWWQLLACPDRRFWVSHQCWGWVGGERRASERESIRERETHIRIQLQLLRNDRSVGRCTAHAAATTGAVYGSYASGWGQCYQPTCSAGQAQHYHAVYARRCPQFGWPSHDSARFTAAVPVGA